MIVDAFTMVLVAEAAFAVVFAKRKGERLVAPIAFFIISVLLVTIDLVEAASRLSGAPVELFSTDLARRNGVELIKSAEEALANAVRWSYYLSIASSIALAAIYVILAAKGFVATAFLAQSGINALLSISNAYVAISNVYRFVGQLFIKIAEISQLFRSLFPFAGLLMIPRRTRGLGATLLAIAVSVSLAFPAIVNMLTPRFGHPERAPERVDDVGAIHLHGLFRAPKASIRGEAIVVREELYPIPPGGALVYSDQGGRVLARPLGQWYLERESDYVALGVSYAGYWLPVLRTTFRPEKGAQLKVACDELPETVPECKVHAENITSVTVNVNASEDALVLFYDASGMGKGWGYWRAKGFFVLDGSERFTGPLPWYNVSNFLSDHQIVAILHPSYCEWREGNESIKIRLSSEEIVDINVKFIEVTAWIEGHFDFNTVCVNGIPAVLKRGMSRLKVGNEIVELEPILSCEISYVEPSLPDARSIEALWFDQWARLINASMPPLTNYSGVRVCLYGRGMIEAVEVDGSVFYSRSLWPRSNVPKAIVRARYYGDLVEPAVIGPVKSGFPPERFEVILPLLSGGGRCPAERALSAFTIMNESVIAGLLYDGDLEPILNGTVAERLRISAASLLEHVGLLAQLAVLLFAAAIATALLSSVVGGFGALHPPPVLRPLRSTLYSLEQVGRGFTSLFTEIVIAVKSGHDPRSLREPLILTALDPAIEIRMSIERLRMGLGYRRSRLRRATAKVFQAWSRYHSLHPLPALLRAASEAAERAALGRVRLHVPYVEKLRLALTDPVARKLIIASDTLYAASLLLESRLGTLTQTIRYAKHFVRGYHLLYPKEMSERDLKRMKKPKLEFEKCLAAVARDLLAGRDPSRSLSKLERLASQRPHLKARYDRYLGGASFGSAEELAARVIGLAAAEGFTRKEFFKLLERYPATALSIADKAALGDSVVRTEWWEAVATTLSRISRERGFETDLGAVWLASLERNEPWRYLLIRAASELAEGREPWFLPRLHPEVKSLLLRVGSAWVSGVTRIDLSSVLRGEGVDEQATRFLQGYADALRGDRYMDLSGAVDAWILSGDMYWAGWAAALSEKQGGAEALVREIFEFAVRRLRPLFEDQALMRSAGGFLERAYRELANTLVKVDERLRSVEHYGLLPSPGKSVALAAEAHAERRELIGRLEGLHQSLSIAIKAIEALLAECSDLKLALRRSIRSESADLLDALERWQRVAVKIIGHYVKLSIRVEDNLRLLRR
ncbi:MAG: hypothetical protein QXU69_05350 [Thermofilaceae archaeon]